MSQGMTKASKILQYVNYRMRITVDDGRQFVGKFMAFDKHMNIVLGDAEEFRRLPVKSASGGKTGEEKEEKRALGLVVVRGDCVVSMTVESKPPSEAKNKLGAGATGPGRKSSSIPRRNLSAPPTEGVVLQQCPFWRLTCIIGEQVKRPVQCVFFCRIG